MLGLLLRICAVWAFLYILHAATHAIAAQTENNLADPIVTQSVATPLKASSPNFILMGDLEPEAAKSLLLDLEEFRHVILELFKAPQGNESEKITIHYIAKVENFVAISPSSTISALYFQARLNPRILLNAQLMGHNMQEMRRALFHEYVHHLTQNYLGYNIPVWLNEGLAEYYATFEKIADGQYLIGQSIPDYYESLEGRSWTPLVTLFDALHQYPYVSGSLDASTMRSQSYFYAQSWLIIHYLQNFPDGMEKLRRFVETLDPLMNSETSFIEIFGLDYLAFEESLRAYVLSGNVSFDLYEPRSEFIIPTTTVEAIDHEELTAERFLISTLLRTGDQWDRFSVATKDQIDNLRPKYASIHLADMYEKMLDADYQGAMYHYTKAQSLIGSSDNITFLKAHLTFAAETKFTSKNVQDVRAVLNEAIREHPHRLPLRLFLISTYTPKSSSTKSDVREQLDFLVQAGFEIRYPDLVTAIVPYLEASKRYDISDRALNIAEIWSTDSQKRLEAYQMKMDLRYSRLNPN